MRIVISTLLLLVVKFGQAEEIKIASKVSDVTVFQSFAKETRVANTNIPAGQHEIVLKDVTQSIDPNSIQISMKGAATLLSVSHRFNSFEDEENTKKMKKFVDSIQIIDDELAWLNAQKTVYTQEENLLNNNIKLGGEKQGFTAADVELLARTYRGRLMEIKGQVHYINKTIRNLSELRAKYQNHINTNNANATNQTSEIVLKVSAKETGLVTIKCSYIMNDAGWSPIYDIRAMSITEPINLHYKAKIYQNSGYDWKKVRLTISTGNPSKNNERPIMNPVYLDFNNNQYQTYKNKAVSKSNGYAATEPAAAQMYLNSYNSKPTPIKLEEKTNATYAWQTRGELVENAVNAEFQIDALQDIKSNGEENIVFVQSFDIPATYIYHTVPKIENTAFLIARLTDWGKYNLINGEANIFFNNMYVGTSTINPNNGADTMLISLGRDERITVKRTKLNDLCTKSLFGAYHKENYVFETTIRNNNSFPILIDVMDQIPVAKNTEITITPIEISNAEYTKEIGKVLWKKVIQPNQSEKIRLSYEVKSPVGKPVVEVY
jgi:uncharacterized protein (TIGR02231 family)